MYAVQRIPYYDIVIHHMDSSFYVDFIHLSNSRLSTVLALFNYELSTAFRPRPFVIPVRGCVMFNVGAWLVQGDLKLEKLEPLLRSALCIQRVID
jgi:hypothetical protein